MDVHEGSAHLAKGMETDTGNNHRHTIWAYFLQPDTVGNSSMHMHNAHESINRQHAAAGQWCTVSANIVKARLWTSQSQNEKSENCANTEQKSAQVKHRHSQGYKFMV